MQSTTVRWRAIAALTAVSTLAQIGQFGIGFMVLPVWLAHRGLDAPRAGLFAAAQWAGMLAGLLSAPELIARFGTRKTVSLGLAASAVAFAGANLLSWPLWIAPGMLIGFGVGLRWIANESWLYSLVPQEWSGRVLGAHEALIATAGVIAPALAAWSGVGGSATLLAGLVLTLVAAIPLWLAGPEHPTHATALAPTVEKNVETTPVGLLVSLGMVVAAVGGIGDGALYGLFPLYAGAHGLGDTQIALLLSCLGLGAMALQLPVGWLADRTGFSATVIACATTSVLAFSAFALAAPLSWVFPASALLVGGMNSAFLTLGMYAAARSEKAEIARNMRLISLTFTGSSIVGPLVAGVAMKRLGADALIWALALASGALAVYAMGVREGRRRFSPHRP